jgi:hypothetical protein
MKTMLGANAVSAAELQKRKLATRDADESIQHLAFLFEEREPASAVCVVQRFARQVRTALLPVRDLRVHPQAGAHGPANLHVGSRVHEDSMTVRCRYPGSASQIAIGLLIAYLSSQVYTYSRPYIEDADDNLANVGNAQIILVFIASLMLFIKDMDEQDGAPGDMFKGPIFSYAMIVIGTLVLVATIYTILVETCEVNPEEVTLPSPKKSKKSAAATEEVARPKPVAAAAAAGSLKPKIDGDQNKKARSADEGYDQINHEIIHEAPDDEAPALPAASNLTKEEQKPWW